MAPDSPYEEPANGPFDKYFNFKVYALSTYDKTEGQSTGFIPLTDIYPWSENPDSSVIAAAYLGNNTFADFHLLEEQYRSLFLKVSNIKETDSVYVYNYASDRSTAFAVKELPLMAHISPYGAEPPVKQEDYLIGFDLQDKLPVPANNVEDYYNAYVCTGTQNPFQKGGIKPILWNKVAPQSFPAQAYGNGLSKADINLLYQFQLENLDYYLINKKRLIVLERGSGKTMLHQILAEDEGSSPTPPSFGNVKDEYGPRQWTGHLFKDKPPVTFGFMYVSFGCETIDFTDGMGSRIAVSCDNRH